MPYFQINMPISPWFIFRRSWFYFQSIVRSIYSGSDTRSIFSPIRAMFRMRMRVVIYSDLNILFLEQYPLPPGYFQIIMHISVLFLVHYAIYFQSRRHLFLDQNQVLDPVLFALLAIRSKYICARGWIFAYNFILYKSKKKKMIMFISWMVSLISIFAFIYYLDNKKK